MFLGENLLLKIGDFGLATRLSFIGEKKQFQCEFILALFVELQIILLLKFWKGRLDILLKSIFGRLELSCFITFYSRYALLFGKPPYETPDVKTTYKRIRTNNYQFPVTL